MLQNEMDGHLNHRTATKDRQSLDLKDDDSCVSTQLTHSNLLRDVPC